VLIGNGMNQCAWTTPKPQIQQQIRNQQQQQQKQQQQQQQQQQFRYLPQLIYK